MSQQTADLDQIISELKHSPLFNLSLSSKELFHSNLLAWLCELYPNHVGRAFASFLKTPPQVYEGLKVYRERHNIDLTLEYSHGEQLIIENKVKSLPRLEQLEAYAEAGFDKTSTSFLLLSLTPPLFADLHTATISLNDGTVWHYLDYQNLANLLLSVQPAIAEISAYHGHILNDYIAFISQLHMLCDLFAINWEDPNSDFFSTRHDIYRLTAIRLHDLIDKLRYAQLDRQVRAQLIKQGFSFVEGDWWYGQADQVLVGSGMTRGTGFFDFKYYLFDKELIGSPIMLGIQLQGNAFRIVFELNDKGKALNIAEQLLHPHNQKKLWFDFSDVPGDSIEYPKKGNFNQYSGTFIYRSKTLSATTPQQLVSLIVRYTWYLLNKAG